MRVKAKLFAAWIVCLGVTTTAFAGVPSPSIQGPITGPGAPFVAGTTFDLAEVGYVQEEFFLSGTATSYQPSGSLGSDGVWDVSPDQTAAYKTRILVHRPINPRKFKGTVVVEWMNVSGGLDASPDWILGHTEMIRSGMAWVGVSAQLVGIEGGGGIVGGFDLPLKTVNPVRYASLNHPGDDFSYDIFSQAGRAVAGPLGSVVLGGSLPNHVIAAGESQSAFRMVSYVNAVHPLTEVFDGYFVHSRGGSAAPIQTGGTSFPLPGGVKIRTDLDVPVFTFQTETDLTILGSLASRQPDTDLIRLWEVAGTAHVDTYTLVPGMTDRGDDPSVADILFTNSVLGGLVSCPFNVNSGPQHFVVNAALHAMNRWVRSGKAPDSAPRLEITGGVYDLDPLGNVLGGVRSPWVDAPIAVHSGMGQTGDIFCILFGTTFAFDNATLNSLYPSEKAFRKAHIRSARDAVRRRHLTRKDARLLRLWARQSDVVPSD